MGLTCLEALFKCWDYFASQLKPAFYESAFEQIYVYFEIHRYFLYNRAYHNIEIQFLRSGAFLVPFLVHIQLPTTPKVP